LQIIFNWLSATASLSLASIWYKPTSTIWEGGTYDNLSPFINTFSSFQVVVDLSGLEGTGGR
jgi:hypothetical protein